MSNFFSFLSGNSANSNARSSNSGSSHPTGIGQAPLSPPSSSGNSSGSSPIGSVKLPNGEELMVTLRPSTAHSPFAVEPRLKLRPQTEYDHKFLDQQYDISTIQEIPARPAPVVPIVPANAAVQPPPILPPADANEFLDLSIANHPHQRAATPFLKLCAVMGNASKYFRELANRAAPQKANSAQGTQAKPEYLSSPDLRESLIFFSDSLEASKALALELQDALEKAETAILPPNHPSIEAANRAMPSEETLVNVQANGSSAHERARLRDGAIAEHQRLAREKVIAEHRTILKANAISKHGEKIHKALTDLEPGQCVVFPMTLREQHVSADGETTSNGQPIFIRFSVTQVKGKFDVDMIDPKGLFSGNTFEQRGKHYREVHATLTGVDIDEGEWSIEQSRLLAEQIGFSFKPFVMVPRTEKDKPQAADVYAFYTDETVIEDVVEYNKLAKKKDDNWFSTFGNAILGGWKSGMQEEALKKFDEVVLKTDQLTSFQKREQQIFRVLFGGKLEKRGQLNGNGASLQTDHRTHMQSLQGRSDEFKLISALLRRQVGEENFAILRTQMRWDAWDIQYKNLTALITAKNTGRNPAEKQHFLEALVKCKEGAEKLLRGIIKREQTILSGTNRTLLSKFEYATNSLKKSLTIATGKLQKEIDDRTIIKGSFDTPKWKKSLSEFLTLQNLYSTWKNEFNPINKQIESFSDKVTKKEKITNQEKIDLTRAIKGTSATQNTKEAKGALDKAQETLAAIEKKLYDDKCFEGDSVIRNKVAKLRSNLVQATIWLAEVADAIGANAPIPKLHQLDAGLLDIEAPARLNASQEIPKIDVPLRAEKVNDLPLAFRAARLTDKDIERILSKVAPQNANVNPNANPMDGICGSPVSEAFMPFVAPSSFSLDESFETTWENQCKFLKTKLASVNHTLRTEALSDILEARTSGSPVYTDAIKEDIASVDQWILNPIKEEQNKTVSLFDSIHEQITNIDSLRSEILNQATAPIEKKAEELQATITPLQDELDALAKISFAIPPDATAERIAQIDQEKVLNAKSQHLLQIQLAKPKLDLKKLEDQIAVENDIHEKIEKRLEMLGSMFTQINALVLALHQIKIDQLLSGNSEFSSQEQQLQDAIRELTTQLDDELNQPFDDLSAEKLSNELQIPEKLRQLFNEMKTKHGMLFSITQARTVDLRELIGGENILPEEIQNRLLENLEGVNEQINDSIGRLEATLEGMQEDWNGIEELRNTLKAENNQEQLDELAKFEIELHTNITSVKKGLEILGEQSLSVENEMIALENPKQKGPTTLPEQILAQVHDSLSLGVVVKKMLENPRNFQLTMSPLPTGELEAVVDKLQRDALGIAEADAELEISLTIGQKALIDYFQQGVAEFCKSLPIDSVEEMEEYWNLAELKPSEVDELQSKLFLMFEYASEIATKAAANEVSKGKKAVLPFEVQNYLFRLMLNLQYIAQKRDYDVYDSKGNLVEEYDNSNDLILKKFCFSWKTIIEKSLSRTAPMHITGVNLFNERKQILETYKKLTEEDELEHLETDRAIAFLGAGSHYPHLWSLFKKLREKNGLYAKKFEDFKMPIEQIFAPILARFNASGSDAAALYEKVCFKIFLNYFSAHLAIAIENPQEKKTAIQMMRALSFMQNAISEIPPADNQSMGNKVIGRVLTTSPALMVAPGVQVAIKALIASQNPGLSDAELADLIDYTPFLGQDYTEFTEVLEGLANVGASGLHPDAIQELAERYQKLLQAEVHSSREPGFFSATGFLRSEETKDGFDTSLVALSLMLNKPRQEDPEAYLAYRRVMREFSNLDPTLTEDERLKDDNLYAAQAFGTHGYKSPLDCMLSNLAQMVEKNQSKPEPTLFPPHLSFEFDMLLMRQNALIELPEGDPDSKAQYLINLRKFVNTHLSPRAEIRDQASDILNPVLHIEELEKKFGLDRAELAGFNQGDIGSFTRAFCGKHSTLINALEFFNKHPQMLESHFWRNLLRCAFSQVWQEEVIQEDENGNKITTTELHHIIENHVDSDFRKYFQKWCSTQLNLIKSKSEKQQATAIAKLIFELSTQLEASTEHAVTDLATTRKGEEKNIYKLSEAFSTLFEPNVNGNQFKFYNTLIGFKPDQQVGVIERAVQYWIEMVKKYPTDENALKQLLISSVMMESFKKTEEEAELKLFLRTTLYPDSMDTAKFDIEFTKSNGELKILGRRAPMLPPEYSIIMKKENGQYVHQISTIPGGASSAATVLASSVANSIAVAANNVVAAVAGVVNPNANPVANVPYPLDKDLDEALRKHLKSVHQKRADAIEEPSESSALLRQKTEQNVREILSGHSEWIEENKKDLLHKGLLPHFNTYKLTKLGEEKYGVGQFTTQYHLDLARRRVIATLQSTQDPNDREIFCLCHYIPDSVEPKQPGSIASLIDDDVQYKSNLRKLLAPVLGTGSTEELGKIEVVNLEKATEAKAAKQKLVVEFDHKTEENPARLSKFSVDLTNKNHVLDPDNHPLEDFLTADYLQRKYSCMMEQSSLIYEAPVRVLELEEPLTQFVRSKKTFHPAGHQRVICHPSYNEDSQELDIRIWEGSETNSLSDCRIVIGKDATNTLVIKSLSGTQPKQVVQKTYWGQNTTTVYEPFTPVLTEAETKELLQHAKAVYDHEAYMQENKQKTERLAKNRESFSRFVDQLAKQEKIGIDFRPDLTSYSARYRFTREKKKDNHTVWFSQAMDKPGKDGKPIPGQYSLLIVEPITCAVRYRIEVTPGNKERIYKITERADEEITLADNEVEKQLLDFMMGGGMEGTLFQGTPENSGDENTRWPVPNATRVENRKKTSIPEKLFLTHTTDNNGRQLGFKIDDKDSSKLLCNQDPTLRYNNVVNHPLFQNVPPHLHYTILPFEKIHPKADEFDTKYYVSLSYQDLKNPQRPADGKKPFEHHPFLEFELTGEKIKPVQKIPGTLFLANLYLHQGQLDQAWKELSKLTLVERQELKKLYEIKESAYEKITVRNSEGNDETHCKKAKNVVNPLPLRLLDEIENTIKEQIIAKQATAYESFSRVRLAELNALLLKVTSINQFQYEADIEAVCKRGSEMLEGEQNHGSKFFAIAQKLYQSLSEYRKNLDTTLPKDLQLSPQSELDLIELVKKLTLTLVKTSDDELSNFFVSPEAVRPAFVQVVAKAIAGDPRALLKFTNEFAIKAPSPEKEKRENERAVVEKFEKMLYEDTAEFKCLTERANELREIIKGIKPSEESLPKQVGPTHSIDQISTTVLFTDAQVGNNQLFRTHAPFPAATTLNGGIPSNDQTSLSYINNVTAQYSNYFESLKGIFAGEPALLDGLNNSTNLFQASVKPDGNFGRAFNQFVDYFKFDDAINFADRAREGNIPPCTYRRDLIENTITPMQNKLWENAGALPDQTGKYTNRVKQKAEALAFLTERLATVKIEERKLKNQLKNDIDAMEAELQELPEKFDEMTTTFNEVTVEIGKLKISGFKISGFYGPGDSEADLAEWYELWKKPSNEDTELYTKLKKALTAYEGFAEASGAGKHGFAYDYLDRFKKLVPLIEGYNNRLKEPKYSADAHRVEIRQVSQETSMGYQALGKNNCIVATTGNKKTALINKLAPRVEQYAKLLGEQDSKNSYNNLSKEEKIGWLVKGDISFTQGNYGKHQFSSPSSSSYWKYDTVERLEKLKALLEPTIDSVTGLARPSNFDPATLQARMTAPDWATLSQQDQAAELDRIKDELCQMPTNQLYNEPKLKIFIEQTDVFDAFKQLELAKFEKPLTRQKSRSANYYAQNQKGKVPDELARVLTIAEYAQKLAMHRYQTTLRNQFIAYYRNKAETIIKDPGKSQKEVTKELKVLSLHLESLIFNFLTETSAHAKMMETDGSLKTWIYDIADGLVLFRKSLDETCVLIDQDKGTLTEGRRVDLSAKLKVGIQEIDDFKNGDIGQQIQEIADELTRRRDEAHEAIKAKGQALVAKLPKKPEEVVVYAGENKRRKVGQTTELFEGLQQILLIRPDGVIEKSVNDKPVNTNKVSTTGALVNVQKTLVDLLKSDVKKKEAWKKTLEEKIGLQTYSQSLARAKLAAEKETGDSKVSGVGMKYRSQPLEINEPIRNRPRPAAAARSIRPVKKNDLSLSSLQSALHGEKPISEHLTDLLGNNQKPIHKLFADLYQHKQVPAGLSKAETDKQQAKMDKELDKKVQQQMALPETITLLNARLDEHAHAHQLGMTPLTFGKNDIIAGFRRNIREQNQWEAKGTDAAHQQKCNELISGVTAQNDALKAKKTDLENQILGKLVKDATVNDLLPYYAAGQRNGYSDSLQGIDNQTPPDIAMRALDEIDQLLTQYLIVSVEQAHLEQCRVELAKAPGSNEKNIQQAATFLSAPIAYELSNERSRDYLVYEHKNKIRLTKEEILGQTTQDLLTELEIDKPAYEQFAEIYQRDGIPEGVSEAEAEKILEAQIDQEMAQIENDPNSDLKQRLKIFDLDPSTLTEEEKLFEDAIIRELEFARNDLKAGYRRNLKNRKPWVPNQAIAPAEHEQRCAAFIENLRVQKTKLETHIRDEQLALEKMLNPDTLEVKPKSISGARTYIRVEDLVDSFMIGNLEAYRAILSESEFSNDDILEIDHRIRNYLYAAVEHGHLTRSLDEYDTSKEKTAAGKVLDKEVASRLSSRMAYNLADERARLYLAFEYRQEIRLRSDQIDALNNLSPEDAVIQMIMGGGKTSVLGALLLRQMADKKKAAIFIAPGAQVDTLSGNLNENQGKIFNQDILCLRANHRHELTETNLRTILANYKKAKDNCHVILTQAEFFQMLELEYLTLLNLPENYTDDRNGDPAARIAILGELLLDLKENGVALIDEVDLILNPLKEVNFPIGSRVSIRAKYRELMGQFMKYHCDPKITVDVQCKDENGVGRVKRDINGIALKDKNGKEIPITEKKKIVDELRILSGNQAKVHGYPEILRAIVNKFWDDHREKWKFPENNQEWKDQFVAYVLDEVSNEKAGVMTPKRKFLNHLNYSNHNYRDEIALLKFLCTQVAPLCMTRTAGKNFGRVTIVQEVPQEVSTTDADGNPGKPIMKPVAKMKAHQVVPYLAIDTPASTEFGLKEEAALYSLMTAISKGITYEQIRDIAAKDLPVLRKEMNSGEENPDGAVSANKLGTFEALEEKNESTNAKDGTAVTSATKILFETYEGYGIPLTLIYRAEVLQDPAAQEKVKDRIAEINGQWRIASLEGALDNLSKALDTTRAAIEAKTKQNDTEFTVQERLLNYLDGKGKTPNDYLKNRVTEDLVNEFNAAVPPEKNVNCLINIEVEAMEHTVRYYAQGYFFSNPHNLCSQLSARRAFSGTPNRNDTAFYQGMSDVKFDMGTEGKIMDAMLSREKALKDSGVNPIHLLEDKDNVLIEDIFTQVIKKMSPKKQSQVRGFIDVGGVLGEYKNNEAAARAFLSEILQNENMNEIEYVLFYGREDELNDQSPDCFMAIDRNGNREVLKTTLEQTLKDKGIKKTNVFVLYDQRHCEASDIKQDPKAINLLSIGESIERRSLMQAMLRLRQYFIGQDVEYVGLPKAIQKLCPNKAPEDFTVSDLLTASTINLAKEKARMTMRAYQHKIVDVVRSKVMDAMLAIPAKLKKEKPTASQTQINKLAKKQAQDIREAAERFFIKGKVLEPFAAFSSLQALYSPQHLLEEFSKHILKFLETTEGKKLIKLIDAPTRLNSAGLPENKFVGEIKEEFEAIVKIVKNRGDPRWCFPNKILTASPDTEDASDCNVNTETENQTENKQEQEKNVQNQVEQQNELAQEQVGHSRDTPFLELAWDEKRDLRSDSFLRTVSDIITPSPDKDATPRVYSLDAIFQDRHQNTIRLVNRVSHEETSIQVTEDVFGKEILMTENCRFTTEASKHHILNPNMQKPLDRIVIYLDKEKNKLKALLVSEDEAGAFKDMITRNCDSEKHICSKMLLLHGFNKQAGNDDFYSKLSDPNTVLGKQYELLMFKLDSARGRSDFAEMLSKTPDPNAALAEGAKQSPSRLDTFVQRNFFYKDETFHEISNQKFRELSFIQQCQYVGRKKEFDNKRKVFYKEATQLIKFSDTDFNMPAQVSKMNRNLRKTILAKCPEGIINEAERKDPTTGKIENIMIQKIKPSFMEKIRIPVAYVTLFLVAIGEVASMFASMWIAGLVAVFIWNVGMIATSTIVTGVIVFIVAKAFAKLCFRAADGYVKHEFSIKLRTTHWQRDKDAARITHEKKQAERIVASRHPTQELISCTWDNISMKLFDWGVERVVGKDSLMLKKI